jgi:glycosyltransferase 2 family protein
MPAASATSRRLLLLTAMLGFGVYLALACAVDSGHLARGLHALGTGGIALVLGSSLCNYALRFWRWDHYLQALGHRVPRGWQLACYLGGFAFTISPGKAGEAARGLYLRRQGIGFGQSLSALFVERLQDVLAICLLLALTASSLPGCRAIGSALGLSLLLVALALTRPGLSRWLAACAPATGRLGKALRGIAAMLSSARQLLAVRPFFSMLALSTLAWGAEGFGLYWLSHSAGLSLGPAQATAIYTISVLGGAAAFFMPAGLGGMEAAMTALLVASGATLSTAFGITALCRFATLWFAVLLGFLALLWLERRPHHSRPNAPQSVRP